MKVRLYTIYSLIDPRDDTVKYIGLTEYPDIRLKQHIMGDGNIPKREWINELEKLGLAPVMRTIEMVHTLSEAFNREAYWIQYYLGRGVRLVNIRLTPSVVHDKDASLLTDNSGVLENKITLDALIAQTGLKRIELAKLSGISAASIVRIAHGAPTTRVTVVKLVRVLEKRLERSIDIESIEGLNITR